MYSIFKRILDLICVIIFIIITLPFLIIIPLIVFLQDGHHPIFKQKRIINKNTNNESEIFGYSKRIIFFCERFLRFSILKNRLNKNVLKSYAA